MSPKIARRLSRANHHTPLRSSAWIYPSSCHWADGTTRRACPGNRWKSRDRPGRPRICPRWWGRAWLCPTCSCLQTPAKSTVLLTRISRRLCLFFVNGDWASPAHLAELSVSSTMAHGSTAASLTNELVDEDDEEPFSTSPSVWSAEFCFSHRIRASQLQVHSPGSWFAELRRVPFWLFTATPRTRQVGCDWQREPWTRQGPFIVDLIFTINVITWWVRYFITSIELSLSTQIRSFFWVFPSSFFYFGHPSYEMLYVSHQRNSIAKQRCSIPSRQWRWISQWSFFTSSFPEKKNETRKWSKQWTSLFSFTRGHRLITPLVGESFIISVDVCIDLAQWWKYDMNLKWTIKLSPIFSS